ncbi:nucleotide exchange factor GrpE [Paenibacillus sp. J22TS3]|uniref:nucleotide exchange factor GrpE n=1 Tax=Paenibacillus sp. J22TS3 TaxID=2807192 RepID=UPI001B062CD7|nr:nucleotide exchange factor GrpE [Paenibacillus sp. J22TS3]GIP20558.1 nucleotide exchange factor GrpE [Paenibacillus sp. J22TS3]
MKEQQPIQEETNTEKKEDTMNPSNDVNQNEQTEEVQGAEEIRSGDSAEAVEEVVSADSEELERLRAEVQEHQQRFLRSQADFDNFRRRTLKEKEELAKYASAKLITELLPVVDNMDRALTAAQESAEAESFTKGVDMIFRQLEGVLSAEGLTPMNAVGQPFNPEYHQAIMQVESDEYEEGIVVEEVQKGYLLKDKVLRPAMVKVSG